MNKASTSKNLPTLSRLFPKNIKNNPLLLFGVLLLVILAIWMIRVQVILPRQERARFVSAESKLDTAIGTLGNISYTKEKYCYQPQEKYSKGSTSCIIKISIPKKDNLNLEKINTAYSQIKDQELQQVYPFKDIKCGLEEEKTLITIKCVDGVTKSVYKNNEIIKKTAE